MDRWKRMLTALLCIAFAYNSLCAALILQPTHDTELTEERGVFVRAFTKNYEHFSENQLGVKDKLEFLKAAFEDVEEDMKDPQNLMVRAYWDDRKVGFIVFKPEDTPGHLYIAHLAIEPDYWHKGIGSQLVFSLIEHFPDTTHVSLLTRRLNVLARNFYERLNFYESGYTHSGYDPLKYVGFECDMAQLLQAYRSSTGK